MKRKIVADSSADLLELPGVDFVSVPLTINAGSNSWVDDADLDADAMMDTIVAWHGRSTSACPSPEDWIAAFGDADEVFCIPISSGMSGSYNSACVGAKEYMERHPGRRVHVTDTLLASAPMALLCERLAELFHEGLDFDAIVEKIEEIRSRTKLLFCLQSVHTLANNGRMPQAVAAIIGLLNIRMVAIANAEGKGEMVDKARGDRKVLPALIDRLKKMSFDGGKIIIHHCRNLALATELGELIRGTWPAAEVEIAPTRGLCSFYAELGGMLIGFESA